MSADRESKAPGYIFLGLIVLSSIATSIYGIKLVVAVARTKKYTQTFGKIADKCDSQQCTVQYVSANGQSYTSLIPPENKSGKTVAVWYETDQPGVFTLTDPQVDQPYENTDKQMTVGILLIVLPLVLSVFLFLLFRFLKLV
jgi:hypothetical protein